MNLMMKMDEVMNVQIGSLRYMYYVVRYISKSNQKEDKGIDSERIGMQVPRRIQNITINEKMHGMDFLVMRMWDGIFTEKERDKINERLLEKNDIMLNYNMLSLTKDDSLILTQQYDILNEEVRENDVEESDVEESDVEESDVDEVTAL